MMSLAGMVLLMVLVFIIGAWLKQCADIMPGNDDF